MADKNQSYSHKILAGCDRLHELGTWMVRTHQIFVMDGDCWRVKHSGPAVEQ